MHSYCETVSCALFILFVFFFDVIVDGQYIMYTRCMLLICSIILRLLLELTFFLSVVHTAI